MGGKNLIILSDRGFIGKNLYDHFCLKKNLYNVIGLNSKNCNLLNYKSCSRVLQKHTKKKFTLIFLSTYGRFPNDDYNVYIKNTNMIKNFLDSINKKNIEHLIFFSSTCVYGRPPIRKTINESLLRQPNGYYGLSKFVSEELLKLQVLSKLTIIRIPGVYGTNDNNKSIISSFIDCGIKNKKINLYDGGKSLRDYVNVKDITKIIDIIITKKIFKTINIATGKSFSIKSLIKKIEKQLNKKIKIKNILTRHTQFDMKFDNRSLNKIIPKFQFISIEEGIKELIDYKKI